MRERSLSTFVLACPRGGTAHDRCFASLRDSDLEDVEISMHPAHLSAWQHWEEVHRRAASARTDLVLVLEDDVLVAARIGRAIRRWRWTDHQDFAAGFVYNPGGYAGSDTWYMGPRDWYGTCAVVYRPDRLGEIIDRTMQYRAAEPHAPWDALVTRACHDHGRIRVHYPSLAEHLVDEPSAVGNASRDAVRTSHGTFDPDFDRDGDAHDRVDRFGRPHLFPGMTP